MFVWVFGLFLFFFKQVNLQNAKVHYTSLQSNILGDWQIRRRLLKKRFSVPFLVGCNEGNELDINSLIHD